MYLVRHAIAAEPGPEYPDDADRPLTHQGEARFRKEVRALAALDIKIACVLTSPLIRARQTAELLREQYHDASLVETEALAPGGSYRAVLAALSALGDCSSAALVGHAPDIGELAARLLGARGAIEFKKGAICCIELSSLPPAGPGTLRWFVQPRMLRAIED
ncbi:MAG: phosphohistidine phosphatase SixA [Acidobacteria bacterium]|nr:phosphohistidine phosphatase SixA [Acidobacteriota bacterium]